MRDVRSRFGKIATLLLQHLNVIVDVQQLVLATDCGASSASSAVTNDDADDESRTTFDCLEARRFEHDHEPLLLVHRLGLAVQLALLLALSDDHLAVLVDE